MQDRLWTWRGLRFLVGGCAFAWCVIAVDADDPTPPYAFLQEGFTQNLFGVSSHVPPIGPPAGVLGGVAFAPDGDVWSSECVFAGTRLHRFDRGSTVVQQGTTVHPELPTVVDLTATGPLGALLPLGAGGCGLVNHPDGYMYSNSVTGLWKLNPANGSPVDPVTSADITPASTLPAGGWQAWLVASGPGNALGIAVDPQVDANGHHHIVYVGADCHPSLSPGSETCTLWDADPSSGVTQVFARIVLSPFETFLDGIYFDPSGAFLFAAHRDSGELQNGLLILKRPSTVAMGCHPEQTALTLNAECELAQPLIVMASEPDGVAFHATDGFVVTLDESFDNPDLCLTGGGMTVSKVSSACPASTAAYPGGGTMTRFDFGGDFSTPPSQTVYAAGGLRGDLLQVYSDGCIYATQGRLFQVGGTSGVRYMDGTSNPVDENVNSIVQICGGFAVPPGVTPNGQQSEPNIAIVKKTNGTDNDAAPGPMVPVASVVTWSYEVTNAGNVPLSNVTVSDNQNVTVSCPETILAAGASMTCSASGTAVAGQYQNIGTAAGTPPAGLADVVASNPDHYFGSAPAIAILKKTNGSDNAAPGPTIAVGSTVTWTYLVTNSGNVMLDSVSVSDVPVGAIGCPKTTLAPGESMTCTKTGIAVAGPYTNSGTAVGNPPVGQPVAASESDHYFGSAPAVTIVKKTNNTNNDAAPGPSIAVGSPVTWTYLVTNTGNVPLNGVVVTDDKVGAVCTIGELGTNASTSCSTTGVATAGQYVNTGTVTGMSAIGQNVSATNRDHYLGAAPPPTGKIGDFLWRDLNANGVQNVGEPGIGGVTVRLKQGATVVATTTTGTSGGNLGKYLFSNLTAGTYTVVVDGSTLPPGLSTTFTGQGTTATDSSNSPVSVTLATSSSIDLTIDFGYWGVTSPCATTTFMFEGDTALSGTPGNTRTFSVNGLSVKASAFSRTDAGGAWATGYLGLYGGGLGVTDTSEGNGSSNRHMIDNAGGRNNFVLFEFSTPVIVDRAYLGFVVADSDASVWIGTKNNPFSNHLTLSNALLGSLAVTETHATSATAARWANVNPRAVPGNVFVIAGQTGGTNDQFKIQKLEVCK